MIRRGYREAQQEAMRLLYGPDTATALAAARKALRLAPRKDQIFWRGAVAALEHDHAFKRKTYHATVAPTELVEEIESVFKGEQA